MKSLSCKDMGIATCDFVATGATDEEVITAMNAHVAASHSEEIAKMAMDEAAMNAMMHSHITTV